MTIETDDLINILTQSPRPRPPMKLAILAVMIAAVAAFVTIVVLGVRPDLAVWQPPTSFWMKSLMLVAMMALSVYALTRASGPLTTPMTLRPMLSLIIFAATTLILEWSSTDYQSILRGFMLRNFPCCLLCVTLYGALGMTTMTAVMRHYAPADKQRCAGSIGLAAAAAAAAGYSIHCPLDSPTFVVVAYGLPMLFLWAVGRRVLPRYLKW